MLRETTVSIVLILVFCATVAAQQDAELDRLDADVTRHIATQMPGWQHKRGSLIKGSSGVIVEFWSLPNRIVKVSMQQRTSIDDARERLTRFAREEGGVEELRGLGDEAYSWGSEGANIIFRRGKYTVYVTTIADVDRDADAASLTQQQKHQRRASEMKRLSKEVAKCASDALDATMRN